MSQASFVAIVLCVGKRNFSFHVVTGASALALLGFGLILTIGHEKTIPNALYGYEIIIGFGLGALLVTPIINIKVNSRDDDAASAQGLTSQMRILGGNIGLSLATIILNAHLSSDLAGILTPLQISNLRQSLNAVETLTPGQIAAVAASFANAFRSQMQACMGVAGGCLVVALFAWQKHPPTLVSEKERARLDESGTRISEVE